MVVFTQKMNGVTGCTEWDVQDDDYDYHQEIARSSFADMLHDTERNQKYYLALKAAIDKKHKAGQPAHVLDIGTGTGLLSIMAARCGADTIVACEAFQPMADCALKVIADNNLSDKICLIPKRSTELVVGESGDLKHRANILVTEVFDTELIGEGALETFTHAHLELLEDDSIVVPHSGTIYAQVVECPRLQRWNKLMDIADEDGDILIETPTSVKDCNGSAAVHDIQLSQLPYTSFNEILKPIPVLQYDWSGKKALNKNTSSKFTEVALKTGNAQMVFMWWDLKMDTEGDILLSCAPWWQHPDANVKSKNPEDSIPWRDHWMQAIYYFPTEVPVSAGDKLTLIASQDEYSLWFNLNNSKTTLKEDFVRPVCECGVHMTYSRTHVSYMNDCSRNKKHLKALVKHINEDSVCLCLNGASLIGLCLAKLGAKKVLYIESGIIAKRVLNSYISFNKLNDKVQIFENIEVLNNSYPLESISLIFGDPNFSNALVPWDNLRLGHIIGKLKSNLKDDVKIIPGSCSLWTMPVEFLDLHKIKAPLDTCEDIILRQFDQLIEASRSISDDEIEPQPLWEYPCYCRSKPIKIMEISLDKSQDDIQALSGAVKPEGEGLVNGIAFWLEWNLDDEKSNKISSGPLNVPEINERVNWDPHTRQGVKLMEKRLLKDDSTLTYDVKCKLNDGSIAINVSVN